jgi:hypothetical protein
MLYKKGGIPLSTQTGTYRDSNGTNRTRNAINKHLVKTFPALFFVVVQCQVYQA